MNVTDPRHVILFFNFKYFLLLQLQQSFFYYIHDNDILLFSAILNQDKFILFFSVCNRLLSLVCKHKVKNKVSVITTLSQQQTNIKLTWITTNTVF